MPIKIYYIYTYRYIVFVGKMGDEAAGCFSCCMEADGKDCIEAIAAGAIFTPDKEERQMATWQSKLAASFFVLNFLLTVTDAVFGGISIHDTFKSVNEGADPRTTGSYYTTRSYWPRTTRWWYSTTPWSYPTELPTSTSVSPPTYPTNLTSPTIPPSTNPTLNLTSSPTTQSTSSPVSSQTTGSATTDGSSSVSLNISTTLVNTGSPTTGTSTNISRFRRSQNYESYDNYQQSARDNYYGTTTGDGDLSGLNIWIAFYVIFCVIYLPFETLMLIYMLFGFRRLVFNCRQYQKKRKEAKEAKENVEDELEAATDAEDNTSSPPGKHPDESTRNTLGDGGDGVDEVDRVDEQDSTSSENVRDSETEGEIGDVKRDQKDTEASDIHPDDMSTSAKTSTAQPAQPVSVDSIEVAQNVAEDINKLPENGTDLSKNKSKSKKSKKEEAGKKSKKANAKVQEQVPLPPQAGQQIQAVPHQYQQQMSQQSFVQQEYPQGYPYAAQNHPYMYNQPQPVNMYQPQAQLNNGQQIMYVSQQSNQINYQPQQQVQYNPQHSAPNMPGIHEVKQAIDLQNLPVDMQLGCFDQNCGCFAKDDNLKEIPIELMLVFESFLVEMMSYGQLLFAQSSPVNRAIFKDGLNIAQTSGLLAVTSCVTYVLSFGHLFKARNRLKKGSQGWKPIVKFVFRLLEFIMSGIAMTAAIMVVVVAVGNEITMLSGSLFGTIIVWSLISHAATLLLLTEKGRIVLAYIIACICSAACKDHSSNNRRRY